jgi:hypothetical protein
MANFMLCFDPGLERGTSVEMMNARELRFPALAPELIKMFEKEEEESRGITDNKNEREDPWRR